VAFIVLPTPLQGRIQKAKRNLEMPLLFCNTLIVNKSIFQPKDFGDRRKQLKNRVMGRMFYIFRQGLPAIDRIN
jgi:hypothetical protein